jgi:hypothetical protein
MGQSSFQRVYYYSSGVGRAVPVTASRLRSLAASGTIAPVDTIWEGDSQKGVSDSEVKGLFPENHSAQRTTCGSVRPVAVPLSQVKSHSRDAFIS